MAQSLNIQNLKTALIQNNAKMKNWVNTQLKDIKTFQIEWVDELPIENISTSTIYMVKDVENSTEGKNIYIQNVYKPDTGWEVLGSFDAGSVDLSNYYNKEEINDMIQNLVAHYTEEEITAMMDEIWSV